MCSVCPLVCGWKAVDNFVWIPNIKFSSLVNSATNCGSLSDTTFSSKPCSLYTLSLKSLTNPFADISSIVAMKCVIFDNLSQTTKIASFPATIGNLVMKSTDICIHSFSGTSPNFNFPATSSILFFIC